MNCEAPMAHERLCFCHEEVPQEGRRSFLWYAIVFHDYVVGTWKPSVATGC